ncbi:MAG: hypothetical protein Q8O30_08760 [Candidatus Omnitrophota bacterium]|nr:hypothetical protein [Candidatus Omnitrophota bacterium]
MWVIVIACVIGVAYQWISFSNVFSSLLNTLSEFKKQKEILAYNLDSLQKKFIILSKEKEKTYAEAESLKNRIAKLDLSINQAANDKNFLQNENERLNKELAYIKEALRLWEGRVNDLREKELVLEKIATTKKELAQRIQAIKSNSRKAMGYTPFVSGNSGYILKDGEPTCNSSIAVDLEKIVIEKSAKRYPAILTK